MGSFLLLQAGTCIECDSVDPACSPASQAIQEVHIECPQAHYNDMAVLVFSTQTDVIKALLLSEYGEFSFWTLLVSQTRRRHGTVALPLLISAAGP